MSARHSETKIWVCFCPLRGWRVAPPGMPRDMLAKMAENPYQPPEIAICTAADYPAEMPSLQPLLPLWRRVASVALITLGATFTPALLASPVAMAIWAYDPKTFAEARLFAVAALAEGLLGMAIVWLGFRLRRFPKTPATLRAEAVHV